MAIFIFFVEFRNYDFRENHILIMNFRKFLRWSYLQRRLIFMIERKIKIKTEDLNFAMMIFWNFVDFRVSSDSLGVKYRIMQNYKLYEKSAYFENVAGNVNRIQVKFSGNFGINFISVYPGLSHLCWSIQNGFKKSLSFLINFINSRKNRKISVITPSKRNCVWERFRGDLITLFEIFTHFSF